MHDVWDEATLDPFPAFLDSDLPPFDQLIYVPSQVGEGFLHVNGISGGGFNVLHAVRQGQLLRLVPGHLALGVEVALVAHQDEDDLVGLDMCFGLL